MHLRRYLFVVLILSLLAVFSVTFVASAQQPTQPPTCQVLVDQALNQLGTNCAGVEHNTACYGYPAIRHQAFAISEPADFYSQPGDRADLTITAAIQPGPVILAQQQWGLSVMDVQANLPNDLPGKGVVYLQLGGMEVENGVEPNTAVKLPSTGTNVNSTASTDLLTWPPPSIPGHASTTIVNIPASTTLSVDAIDPTGKFARVVYQNMTGWISKSALDSSADFTGLPTIGPNDYTPMQKFYFRTGIGGTPCAVAPALLFVQSPNGVAADINLFDHAVRIQSTIVLRSLPLGDQLGNKLELIVLYGLARIHPDTPGEIIIPPGFKTLIPLCPQFASLGIEGDADEKATCGNWSQPVPLTQADLDGLGVLEHLPNNVINYSIEIPTIFHASGNGGAIPGFIFRNQRALDQARELCAAGKLPARICRYLGL